MAISAVHHTTLPIRRKGRLTSTKEYSSAILLASTISTHKIQQHQYSETHCGGLGLLFQGVVLLPCHRTCPTDATPLMYDRLLQSSRNPLRASKHVSNNCSLNVTFLLFYFGLKCFQGIKIRLWLPWCSPDKCVAPAAAGASCNTCTKQPPVRTM